MQIGAILGWKYPDGGFLVRDDSNGRGPYIAEWKREESQPTNAQLSAWEAEMAAQSEVPSSVTQRQAKLALLSAGLLDDVETAIDAIADPATKRVAQIEWEYAQEVRRDWPLLVQLATSMGMTSTDLDELFTQAALL